MLVYPSITDSCRPREDILYIYIFCSWIIYYCSPHAYYNHTRLSSPHARAATLLFRRRRASLFESWWYFSFYGSPEGCRKKPSNVAVPVHAGRSYGAYNANLTRVLAPRPEALNLFILRKSSEFSLTLYGDNEHRSDDRISSSIIFLRKSSTIWTRWRQKKIPQVFFFFFF